MIIIPAIDIINGKCVRLSQGDYSRSVIYNDNPVEVAQNFEAAGITHLHVVDLDGAKARSIQNIEVLKEICSRTSLQVDFGGGLSSRNDVELALEAGAKQVTLGSIAALEPAIALSWLNEFGTEKIILGADATNRKVATHGWAETTQDDVVDFIQQKFNEGFTTVICTDTAKDGMLAGPSIELYEDILLERNIKLIASGGVSTIDDLKKLKSIGCYGAIVGKAYYEGKISLKEMAALC